MATKVARKESPGQNSKAPGLSQMAAMAAQARMNPVETMVEVYVEQSEAFIDGERLYLREVQLADAEGGYHRWMNDAEVTRYLESRFYPHSVESLKEFISGNQGPDNLLLAIVEKNGHRHIGNIKLGPINWLHRRGDIGILIGEKDCWGKGYATEAVQLLTDYAFDSLNLHKVTAGCYDLNEGSARAFEKAGFVREATRPGHYYHDGVYVNEILLGRIDV